MLELHFSKWSLFSLQILMPFNCLGLLVGDTDADSAIGPPIDGALRAENGAFLNTEDGSILAFD